MRSVTAETITEAFLGYFGDEVNPRTHQLMERLAHHVHEFAKEVELTHDEWRACIEFLTEVGNITTAERNEFVLLSDVLGLSSLVDMIHSDPHGTSSSVLGPFHISNPPRLPYGGDLKRDNDGELVLVQGRVVGPAGEPISGAELDIWQTATNGMYSSQDDAQDTFNFHGLMTTDESGRYAFTTVKPVPYTVPTDGPVGRILDATGRHPWRPSHLHVIARAQGFRTLVTEIFPDDDPYLDQDTVFGVRSDLVMRYQARAAAEFPDGMVLSGQVETAFEQVDFDLRLVAD
ncbi:MAG: dioxygenase [Pseudomonadota bacterium]